MVVMNAEGNIGDHMHLTNDASKGKSGRIIALNKDLKKQLIKTKENEGITIDDAGRSVIQTKHEQGTSAQVIVNAFQCWLYWLFKSQREGQLYHPSSKEGFACRRVIAGCSGVSGACIVDDHKSLHRNGCCGASNVGRYGLARVEAQI